MLNPRNICGDSIFLRKKEEPKKMLYNFDCMWQLVRNDGTMKPHAFSFE